MRPMVLSSLGVPGRANRLRQISIDIESSAGWTRTTTPHSLSDGSDRDDVDVKPGGVGERIDVGRIGGHDLVIGVAQRDKRRTDGVG